MKIKEFFNRRCYGFTCASTAPCSNNKSASKASDGYTPKELNVQFVLVSKLLKLCVRAKALLSHYKACLEKQLHMPVHVTVSPDNSALVEQWHQES